MGLLGFQNTFESSLYDLLHFHICVMEQIMRGQLAISAYLVDKEARIKWF